MAVVIVPSRTRRPPSWPMRLRGGHPLADGLLAFVPLTQPAYFRNLVNGQGPTAGVYPTTRSFLARQAGRASSDRAGLYFEATNYLSFALSMPALYPVSMATGYIGVRPANSSYPVQLGQASGTDYSGLSFFQSSGGILRVGVTGATGASIVYLAGDTLATSAPGESCRATMVYFDNTNRALFNNQKAKVAGASAASSIATPVRLHIGARYNAGAMANFATGAIEYAVVWARGLTDGEGWEINDNPWQIVERDVQRVYLAPAAGGSQALAGASTGSGTAAAGITQGVPLAGASVAGATGAAALALVVPLAGAATGSAGATADLSHVVTLFGAGITASTGSGAVSLSVPLAGAAIAGVNSAGQLLIAITLQVAAVANALGSAALSVGNQADLVGAATGGATSAADIAIAKLLAGAGAAGGQGTASLSLDVRIAGSALAAAVASGALTVTSASSIAGDATAGGAGAADLTIGKPIAGAAQAAATGAANLGISIPLSGAAIASAQETGALTVTLSFGGAAITGSAATAALTLAVNLQGAASAGATSSAAFPDGALLNVPAYTVAAQSRRLAVTARKRQYTTTARPRRLEIRA